MSREDFYFDENALNMAENMLNNLEYTIPTVALRGITLFPDTFANIDVVRSKSLFALDEAITTTREIFCITQKNSSSLNPTEVDLYDVGVVCKIIKSIKINDTTTKFFLQCLYPAKAISYVQTTPYIMTKVKQIFYEKVEDFYLEQAYLKMLKNTFFIYFEHNFSKYPELLDEIEKIKNPNKLINLLTFVSQIAMEDKNALLQEQLLKNRMDMFLYLINKEIHIRKIENTLNEKVKAKIDKNQKDYVLKEKIKTIQEELGTKNSVELDIAKYKDQIKTLNPPTYVVEKLEEEFSKLETLSPQSQEIGNIKDYISKTLSLPWGENSYSEENKNLDESIKILDKDHYGLIKVKERIIEHIAVTQHCEDTKGTILCLVGPPGVGKTSIAKSVAAATNRSYVRVSLGGLRDEADIRGHRRTYIGATWGRIINSIKEAKTSNPVILFDEIDKMSNDYKGDPSSAMLEVLDPEQNKTFRDHYLELDFDLSKCLFICTANTLQNIPSPLLDRMEVINLSTYTKEEKYNIAKLHIIPKAIKNHNLSANDISFTKTGIDMLIDNYTLEAGVRNLEKNINKICRKVVVKKLTDKPFKKVSLSKNNIELFLGAKHELKSINTKVNKVGKVNGLAYTSYGGTVLPMEFTNFNGSGKLDFTGNIGKVMMESFRLSFSYLRSKSKDFGYEDFDFSKQDFSIHVPEGATPKDGPSAGITLTVGLYSLLTNKKVKGNIAMTGEISLLGDILPIGGLKEKILAGKNHGITTYILPKKNKSTFDDLEDYVKKDLTVHFVTNFKEVINLAFIS